MEGYVFLANSTKPTEDKYNSREDVHPSNVSRPCLKKALEMGYKVYLGINRKVITCPVKLLKPEKPRRIAL